MIVKLLTEHNLEFLSLKEGCRGSSESTHVKMPHCRKSHALAHMINIGANRLHIFSLISSPFVINISLTFYIIETPFNTFLNREEPDQAAFVRAA